VTTQKWDDEEEVTADVDSLLRHIEELQAKYGDRLTLYADDPFCEWGSIDVALERDLSAKPYKPRIIRKSYRRVL
jgi:hypothetical protein